MPLTSGPKPWRCPKSSLLPICHVPSLISTFKISPESSHIPHLHCLCHLAPARCIVMVGAQWLGWAAWDQEAQMDGKPGLCPGASWRRASLWPGQPPQGGDGAGWGHISPGPRPQRSPCSQVTLPNSSGPVSLLPATLGNEARVLTLTCRVSTPPRSLASSLFRDCLAYP